MNNRELEVRLLNLERQVLAIANREGIRDNESESKIGVLDGKTNDTNTRVSDLEEYNVLSEEALCDVDEAHTDRLDAIEEALCELSAML